MSTHFTHNTCFGRTALALLLALLTTATARAQVLQDEGWYYMKIDENHAVITGINLSTDATGIIIPAKLGEVPVTGFGVDFTLEKYTELTSLKFPPNSSITTIPTDFVRGCSKLGVVCTEGNGSATGYFLPTSITTIEAGAFAGTKLDQLTMPSVTAIGRGAFEGCNTLRRVTISQAATIADDAFANTDGTTRCFITYNGPLANWNYKAYRRSPKVVVFCTDGSCGWAGDTGTENCVFWTRDANNHLLFACDDADAYSQHPDKQVKLNNNWAYKPDGTGNYAITSLTMRNVYTTGGWSARKTLVTVDLKKGVTAIDEDAFKQITALTSVSMTADVRTIGEFAFYLCSSLKGLYFWGSFSQWNSVRKGNNWNFGVPSTFQVHWRCTATFDMQGHGTAPESHAVWNGEKVTQPTAPTAQGYQFGGWYTDADCTAPYDFSTTLDDDITLYAKWTALENTISFYTDNKGTTPESQTVTSGYTVTEPEVQFVDGEGIEGWYTDEACQQRYDFSTPVDHSMTLYAKWVTAGTATFNVTDSEHGTVTLTDAQGRTPNASGWLIPGQYTLTVKPQSGYTFSGTYELTKRGVGHTAGYDISGSTERSYTVNLTEDDVTVTVTFSTQPIVNINVATDGNAAAGTWTLTDGFGNDYVDGSVVTVPDEFNPNPGYVMKLTITETPSSTGIVLSIVNGGKTSIRDNITAIEFSPSGSIIINLFFYDKTTGVVTLLNDDSNQPEDRKNATLIGNANGKKRLVTLSGRTLPKDGNWNTLCLPFDVEFAGSPISNATVMELDTEGTYDGHQTGFDDGTLRLYFKEAASIKAGMPYLIKWDKPKNYNPTKHDITNPSFAGVIINSDAPTAVTSADGKVTFTGAYSPVAITAKNRSILYLGAENTLYYPNVAMTIGSCRAHFELNGITAGDQNTEVRSYELNFGEGATNSIDNVQRSLFNVQRSTFNVPSEAWFSLDGRRLNGKPSQPGVYINNGRKIMVK